MTITALSGPQVTFGQTQTSTGNGVISQVADYNSQRGPSLFDLAYGMLDPRQFYTYQVGAGATAQTAGFYEGRGMVDFIPTALSSNLLAISSNTQPVANTAITLLSSKTGVTATTITAPETGTTTGTLLCLDSTAAFLPFGSDGAINLWNPAFGTGRCIVISPSSNLDGGSFSIAGRDMYGFKMTETLAAGSTTITGTKAFKYISAVVASTTITSTGIGIGTTDIYGLPLLVSESGPVNLSIAVSTGAGGGNICTTINPSSTTLVFGSTAATATSTTGDPRGTFSSSLASGSSNRFMILVRPTANQLNGVSNTSVATLFGATQYSSV